MQNGVCIWHLQAWLASDDANAGFIGFLSAFCGQPLLAASFIAAAGPAAAGAAPPHAAALAAAVAAPRWLPSVTEGMRWLVAVLREGGSGAIAQPAAHLRYLVVQFLAVQASSRAASMAACLLDFAFIVRLNCIRMPRE